MLTQVDIQNYRGFERYRLSGLSRVNLFVGMNNSGKTALLEGIQFLASGGDPSVLAQAAFRRGELIIRRPDSAFVDVAHFFFNHLMTVGGSFSIAGNNGYSPVIVKIVAVPEGSPEVEGSQEARRRPVQYAVKIEGGRRRNNEPRFFPLTVHGGVNFDDPAAWRFEVGERVAVGRPSAGSAAPTRFIGTDLADGSFLAEMLDGVAVQGRETRLADALQVLDRKLEYVRQLSGATALGYRGSRAGVIAKLLGVKDTVPLGSLGEGMRRMLTLAAALATTEKGYLFIDEVDTGLHYSVMHKMWELVIEAANAYDIQIFATTHSYDCIFGLAKLFRIQPDLKQIFSMQRIEPEKSEGVAFDAEEVLASVRSDIEIR